MLPLLPVFRFRPNPAVLSGTAISISSGPAVQLAALPPLAGCERPSINTVSVILGRVVAGTIVCVPLPGMLKVIVSSMLALLLASADRLAQAGLSIRAGQRGQRDRQAAAGCRQSYLLWSSR